MTQLLAHFIWPCFAGLNEQASEQSRGEMRYWCAVCCPANQPACQCINRYWPGLSWLSWGLPTGWLPSLLGWGYFSAQHWPSLWFMSSSLLSVSLLSSCPCSRSEHACSWTSHSPEHKQDHPVSTTDIVIYKQMRDMQQMCEFISLLKALAGAWSLDEKHTLEKLN